MRIRLTTLRREAWLAFHTTKVVLAILAVWGAVSLAMAAYTDPYLFSPCNPHTTERPWLC